MLSRILSGVHKYLLCGDASDFYTFFRGVATSGPEVRGTLKNFNQPLGPLSLFKNVVQTVTTVLPLFLNLPVMCCYQWLTMLMLKHNWNTHHRGRGRVLGARVQDRSLFVSFPWTSGAAAAFCDLWAVSSVIHQRLDFGAFFKRTNWETTGNNCAKLKNK